MTVITNLSEDDRATIEDAVTDWVFVAEYAAPMFSANSHKREAYQKIILDLRAGYTVDMAVANLNDDREAVRYMHEKAVYDEGLQVERDRRAWAGSR